MMTCNHTHISEVHLKHNDTASFRVPHLGLNHHGYVPNAGIFSGDETSFDVCLDCGQIQNWIPITDDDILSDDTVKQSMRSKKPKSEDLVISGNTNDQIAAEYKQNLTDALKEAFGDEWIKQLDALNFINMYISCAALPIQRYAAKMLLKEIHATTNI
jgi:hypothetical protein